jgi:hypothetical protein
MDNIRPMMDEIQKNGLHINGVDFNLTFYLGGDMPFLAAMLGLVGHIHTFFCLWCLIMKEQAVALLTAADGTRFPQR